MRERQEREEGNSMGNPNSQHPTPNSQRPSSPLRHFFPRSADYARLRATKGSTVREHRHDGYPFPYGERHLQCAWFDPLYRPALLETGRGEPVRVEDAGRWNLEAGPDFLDAILVVGPEQRMLRGDVEVHVHPGDWNAHGHGGDPRYERLVAHVTYAPHATAARHASQIVLPAGAVQISLRDALRSDPAFSFENIDVAAYPYGAAVDRPPCAELLLSWGPDERASLLECAGEERLRAKAVRMRAAILEAGPGQVLYEELLAALGYKHNRVPFRQLARAVTLDRLTQAADGDVLGAYALLLGVAGLLPQDSPSQRDRETTLFVRSLWDRWWKMQSAWQRKLMQPEAWRLSGIRPQNHPARRLAAAASLFAGEAALPIAMGVPEQPSSQVGRAVSASRLPDADTPGSRLGETPRPTWLKGIANVLRSCDGIEYWLHRLSLGGKRQEKPTALLGGARIGAILSNVIVPFAAANDNDVSALLPGLPPEQDNSLIRETAYKLFGPDHNPALYRNGLRQQGLLQIFHDFCLGNRSGCRDCPLPSALASRDAT